MRCPHCGHEFGPKTLGVTLPGRIMPIIFTAVEKAGAEGILVERLYTMLYGHKTHPPSITVVKQHVFHINERLAETDWKIYGKGGFYRFIRRENGE
jgi:hypothetical protein